MADKDQDPAITQGASGLDDTLNEILEHFKNSNRLDHAHEQFREALREQLRQRGFPQEQLRLMEVNLFGSLSGWLEFILEERTAGRDAVPDFARHLRRAFLAHCRDYKVEPDVAIQMVVELANTFMDLAISYRKRLNLE